MKTEIKKEKLTKLFTIVNSPINEFTIVFKNNSIYLDTKSAIISGFILKRVEEWCAENNCHYFVSCNAFFKLYICISSNIL